VVVTDNGRRWAHYFETAERAIEFYEACLGKATDPESRERFLRAVRARWN
jgi:aspartate aminotransferase-like enzyme